MRKQWSFWITATNGAMRCIKMITATEKEKQIQFSQYHEGVTNTYPFSRAGWMEGWPQHDEIRQLNKEIKELKEFKESVERNDNYG